MLDGFGSDALIPRVDVVESNEEKLARRLCVFPVTGGFASNGENRLVVSTHGIHAG